MPVIFLMVLSYNTSTTSKNLFYKKTLESLKGFFIIYSISKSLSSDPKPPKPDPGGDCACDFFGFKII